ncbi:MAG TPA: SDR family oxidoreductase [Myxococcota bacterium]|nr:SDR family oxidoreductase [Myxococcota bacterium]
MQPPLDGVVLVTGASSGIGRELARLAAARASRLILVARRADRLHLLADELRETRGSLDVRVLPCDLADPIQVDALIDAVVDLPVDVLINNAGLGDLGLFERLDPAKLDQLIGVNVTGLTRLTRGLIGSMVRRGRGGVLNVSSGWGLTWAPGAAVYAGTKHYVTAFTEALRCEVRPAGVSVTLVCPGPVDTEFADRAGMPGGGDPPRWLMQPARACAEQAMRAFEADRALLIPGWAAWLAVSIGRITPAFVFRWIGDPLARWLRVH